jgi:hypothetical protein
MTDKIEDIIKGVVVPSQAEVDRNHIKSIRSLNLISFVDAQITKAASENKLKSLVTTLITKLLEKPSEEMDLLTLTHLLGVLNKSDNEFVLGLITTIKDFYQIEKETDSIKLDTSDTLNAEDIKIARRFYKLFEKFGAAELSEPE